MTRAEMTHRIGRFYSGQPSWRTRLRALRRRLGNASLPLSEEEWLVQVAHKLTQKPRYAKGASKRVRALRIAYPLPPVLLAADGKTTLRYVQTPKNGSNTVLNLLLELTGEAAHRLWYDKSRWLRKSKHYLGEFRLFGNDLVFVTPNEKCMEANHYQKQEFFASEPHADIRFCVVRDPVERFQSVLIQFQIAVFRFKKTVPSLTDGWIDSFLDALENFYAEFDPAANISREEMSHKADRFFKRSEFLLLSRRFHFGFRQTEFLGHDASWYTHIFSLRDLAPAHKLLSELAGKPLSALHANSSREREEMYAAHGFSLERPQLTPAQRRKIETIYAEDYRVFGRWF